MHGIETYHCVVGLLWEHAKDPGNAIGESNSAFDVLLGLLWPEDGCVDNLDDESDSGHVCGKSLSRLAHPLETVLRKACRRLPLRIGHFVLVICAKI